MSWLLNALRRFREYLAKHDEDEPEPQTKSDPQPKPPTLEFKAWDAALKDNAPDWVKLARLRRVRRQQALPLVYFVTAVAGFISYLSLSHGFTLGWFGFFLLAVLGVFLGGHRLVSGPMHQREDLCDWEWQNGKTPSVYIPRRAYKAMIPREVLVLAYREHPIQLVPWCAGALVAQPLLIFISSRSHRWQVFWFGELILTIGLLIVVMIWRRSIWLVTNRRVLKVGGVLSDITGMMPIGKITDAARITRWWSKNLAWFGVVYTPFGSLDLESAGQKQAIGKVNWIPTVSTVIKAIESEVFDLPPEPKSTNDGA